jgi:hypothetical protein
MVMQQLTLPHRTSYNFGVGIDRFTGTALNLAVEPTISTPAGGGANQSFQVTRVSSTKDLQQQLGIDAEASYGCGSFGLGVSARFGFAEHSEVHSSSLFMAVTATAQLAEVTIDECVLRPAAAQLTDNPDAFAQRYGDMFARSCRRGGLFVGILRIETFDSAEATSIEAELEGSYGLFSAEVSVKFQKVMEEHQVNIYCSLYAEGGPALQLHDPKNAGELLTQANTWLAAMQADPDRYSVPYEWVLAPITIADGPLPLNAAERDNAQTSGPSCRTSSTCSTGT